MTKMHDVRLMQHSNARIDSISITASALDVADHTRYKFITEIVFMIFIQNPGNAAACVHIVN